MTVYNHNGVFGVCSRNLDLVEDDGNTFWRIANTGSPSLRHKLSAMNVAIQGELVGPGIQGNPYKLPIHRFFVFNMFDITNQKYLPVDYCHKFALDNGLNHVPVIMKTNLFGPNFQSTKSILELANYTSTLNKEIAREGIVFKKCDNPSISFKAINNNFLLKEKD